MLKTNTSETKRELVIMAGEITFDGWAILELMGYRQRGGYVKDVEMFGGKLLRIDIPVGEGITEFYGCASIYALRPCTEEVARKFVQTSYDDPRPVRPVDFRPIDDRKKIAHDDFSDDPFNEDEEAA